MAVTSVSNPHVKYARRLHRRRMREKEGRCLLEGVRLVADAAEADASFVLGFWEETMLGVPGGEALLKRLLERPPLGGFFEVHPHVMAELAGTETPQGIVIVAQRPTGNPKALLGELGDAAAASKRAQPVAETPKSATLVVLDNVRDPGNVGTVIRSADASGAAGVIFLPGTADPFGPKALRASMGSAFHIPVLAAEHIVLAYRSELAEQRGPIRRDDPVRWGGLARRNVPDETTGADGADEEYLPRTEMASYLPGLLAQLGYRILVADASAEHPHWKAPLDGKAAIVLGSEAEGPDPELWGGAERISIPMFGAAESLNVAMAGAVLLYEAARAREGWGLPGASR